jgi:3-oxosteroid 1-dehydrogenase
MRIENTLSLERAPDEVFNFLIDVDAVAPCLPGARVGAEAPDGSREVRLDVRFGPMRFTYAGAVRIAEVDHAAYRAVLTAQGTESAGEGSASAIVTMVASERPQGATQVDVVTDLTMSGGVAQVGGGMIQDFAEEMFEQFARSLANRLGSQFEDGTSLGQTSRDAPQTSLLNGPPAPALRGSRVIARVLRRRLRRRWRDLRNNGVTLPALRLRRAPHVDLVVVGSGSGALTAAIVAHDAGLRVAIYEKAPVVGGGTAYSGGVVWAPCNHIMRRKGIDDSVADGCAYLRHLDGGRGDPEIQRTYVERVGGIIEEIERWTGISWVIWTGQPDYYPDLPGARANGRAILPHPASASQVLVPAEERLRGLSLVRSTPHMDFVPGFQTSDRAPRHSWLAGRSIVGGLWKAVLERGIEYHVATPAVRLLRRGDAVIGIEVAPPSGTRVKVLADAVLLNTGGFDWNDTLSRRHLAGPAPHPQTPPSNTGDGHIMAMTVGAATALMDRAIWQASIQIPGDTHDEGEALYRMFNLEPSKPHCIVVNSAGRRFAMETAHYALTDAWSHIDPVSRTYPNTPSYLICDSRYRAKYGFPGIRTGEPVPDWLIEAPSLDELARKLGIDGTALAAEIATYNKDCLTGVDSRFGRGRTVYDRYWGDPNHDGPNPTMGPLEEAPFYAIEMHRAHAGTLGGVTISTSGEVLRADGARIEGLYACGNLAANVIVGAGYASGTAIGGSIVFGYLAAKHVIAKHVPTVAGGDHRLPAAL